MIIGKGPIFCVYAPTIGTSTEDGEVEQWTGAPTMTGIGVRVVTGGVRGAGASTLWTTGTVGPWGIHCSIPTCQNAPGQ